MGDTEQSEAASVQAAEEAFFRSVEADRLAHAYLVVGRPEGQGAAFAQRALAYLFCASADKPCGTCRACLQVERRSHPDVFWIEPESKSRRIVIGDESQVGIRDVTRFLSMSPFEGGWKACVILHADRMTEAAANAFLKTLEEPSGKSVIFLLTEAPQALLPTICSRCQRIRLPSQAAEAERPWEACVVEILKAGSPADPLERMRLAARLEEVLEAERARIEQALKEGEGPSQEEADREVLDARIEARVRAARAAILRFMVEWHRDLLLASLNLDESLLHNRKEAGTIRRLAQGLPYGQAMASLRNLEQVLRRLERNMPPEAVLEEAL